MTTIQLYTAVCSTRTRSRNGDIDENPKKRYQLTFIVCISGIALHAVLKIRSKSGVEMEDDDETELGEATNPLITNVSSDEEEIFNTATS